MKRCTKCLMEKPLSEFYRLASSKDGHRPDCKACEQKPARIVTVEERFWSKVKKSDECWTWTGSTNTNNGYGRFWADGRHVIAHRYVYELFNGQVSDDLEVCHHCDNPACVRPDHLYSASHTKNVRDALRRGRVSTALSVDDVRLARRLLDKGLTQKEIGERLGVGHGAISHIARGTTWGWLE